MPATRRHRAPTFGRSGHSGSVDGQASTGCRPYGFGSVSRRGPVAPTEARVVVQPGSSAALARRCRRQRARDVDPQGGVRRRSPLRRLAARSAPRRRAHNKKKPTAAGCHNALADVLHGARCQRCASPIAAQERTVKSNFTKPIGPIGQNRCNEVLVWSLVIQQFLPIGGCLLGA